MAIQEAGRFRPLSSRWWAGARRGGSEEGCVRRIEQQRPGLIAWWVGRGAGLQQGWTLEQRPDGEGPLILEVSFEGASAWLEGEDVALVSADGGRWRYGQVAAWDASGAPLLA